MANALCDDHVGEDHPPRCSLCESLQADYAFMHIDFPQSIQSSGVIENDSHHASSSRVVWLGIDCAWAACGRCNFDGPRHYGLLCHGQALIDLEQHASRHRNIPTHPNTISRSN